MFARILPIALIAFALAPGTFFRTPVQRGLDTPITFHAVDEPGKAFPDGWALQGVWEYRGDGEAFGGFSALIALHNNTLRAFSDRGVRFTFRQPDKPQEPFAFGGRVRPPTMLDVQLVTPGYWGRLWDIESATIGPKGQYWLGYENVHAVQRFSLTSEVEDVRVIEEEVEWGKNSGAEAMVRLRDGRFVIIPEWGGEGLIYRGDPVTHPDPTRFTYEPPIRGYGITDAKQLPDGRLIILTRKVVWGLPPFEPRIAIAELPRKGEPQVMKPEFVLNLAETVPPENYEGIALRERGDGMLDVWLISDDNASIMQRTLVVKLRFDPKANAIVSSDTGPNEEAGSQEPAKQKARE